MTDAGFANSYGKVAIDSSCLCEVDWSRADWVVEACGFL